MLPQERTMRQILLCEITLHCPAVDVIMSDRIETSAAYNRIERHLIRDVNCTAMHTCAVLAIPHTCYQKICQGPAL